MPSKLGPTDDIPKYYRSVHHYGVATIGVGTVYVAKLQFVANIRLLGIQIDSLDVQA